MFMVNLRQRLQEERCGKDDVHTHFDTMRTMCEDLAAIGGSISDGDFTVMILRLLPASYYDTYSSAITATVSVTNTTLNPEALMVSIIDEYDGKTVKSNKNKKDDENTAFCLEVLKRAMDVQRKYWML
jgi:hypothetical protein